MVESDFGLCAECWAQTSFLGQDVCDCCGRPVVADASDLRVICDFCMKDTPPWSKGRSAFLYSGAGRSMVLALKHGDRSEIVLPAARWLYNAAKPLLDSDFVVAPVPLHRLRFLKRRFNQSALVAAALADLADLQYCPDLLLRTRAPGSLEGLGAEDRAKKLRNAIDPNPAHLGRINGAKILLVDDVLTSGATLRSATQACYAANATEVRVVTLARVAKSS